MRIFHPKGIVLALLFALMLVSCKSNGSGMMAGGGIGGTGIISSGYITGFGSIVVNGTEFDTSNAAIIINGKEVGVGDNAALENLDIGRVVTAQGWISKDGLRFVADRVVYSSSVKGPVEGVIGIDPTTNEKEVEVLGQTVIVGFTTKFKETSFDTIAEGDVVEVSGYLDDTGAIRATFLEKTGDITTISTYEVTGFVENLDAGLNTFMINNIKVDYSSIANDLPEDIPAENLFIEVEGTLALEGELLATKLQLGDELGGEDGDEVEIIGFVTEILSDMEIIGFRIGNQIVHVDPDIVVSVDGAPDDIALGVKLEAEGSLVDGILIADEIEFWEPDQIEREGLVTGIVSVSEFTVGNQVVQTNDETVFEGGTPDDIAYGVHIEIKGKPVDSAHSVLIADKVSFEEN
jgi:hypothetical protein